MGKRERRRQRERLVADGASPTLPRRHDVRPAIVRVAGDSLTSALEHLVEQQHAAEEAVELEVNRLVSLGLGWPQIAHALGVSRQAARQRWVRRTGS